MTLLDSSPNCWLAGRVNELLFAEADRLLEPISRLFREVSPARHTAVC
jgi:hypothetical protein